MKANKLRHSLALLSALAMLGTAVPCSLLHVTAATADASNAMTWGTLRIGGGGFVSGIVIAAVCLFFVPPLGEIASSAISIVSELLVLCGAILGVKASYDVKFHKFEAELQDVIDNEKKLNTQTDNE